MSESITINVPHKLTKQEARNRIEGGFDKVGEQIGAKGVAIQQNWVEDIMNFEAGAMGQTISGTLEVTDSHVNIAIDLPWFLAKLGSGLKERLSKTTQVLLEKK